VRSSFNLAHSSIANPSAVIKSLQRRFKPPAKVTLEPFSEFHLFPELAPELRLNIWNLAAHIPRLIEIEHAPNHERKPLRPAVLQSHNSELVRVAPRCRRSPVVLRVCRESREEGLKVYTLTNFDCQWRPNLEREIFYNPQADIVFFNDNFCYWTLAALSGKR